MKAAASRLTKTASSRSVRVALMWAMWLVVAAYAAGLVLHADLPHQLVDLWLSLLTDWVPVLVCWLAVWRVGFGSWEVLLAAAAMTSLAAGDTYYAPRAGGWSPIFPSPGDVGYVMFYILMLAALVVVVRHDARGRASSMWLDCAVGSLGAASVLAFLLSPVLASALARSYGRFEG